MLFVVTTRTAPIAIATAKIQKKKSWATKARRSLLACLLDFRSELERLGLRNGELPLAEFVHVVEEVGDPELGVFVLGAPEERIERADLDADPAVHAQRVVDVEAIEDAHRAVATTLTARRALLLVPLDVDAPVGARPGAQHADRAVLLLERDHAARSRDGLFLLVRVLHGDGRLQHRLERDAEATDHAGKLLARHQTQTLNKPVSRRLARPIGIRNFQAK